MPNNISLTVRLSHELNTQLKVVSKKLGMTRTNLLRGVIHDILPKEEVLDFSSPADERDRFVLNVNELTHSILQDACEKHAQPMNAVMTAVAHLALARAARWLPPTEK